MPSINAQRSLQSITPYNYNRAENGGRHAHTTIALKTITQRCTWGRAAGRTQGPSWAAAADALGRWMPPGRAGAGAAARARWTSHEAAAAAAQQHCSACLPLAHPREGHPRNPTMIATSASERHAARKWAIMLSTSAAFAHWAIDKAAAAVAQQQCSAGQVLAHQQKAFIVCLQRLASSSRAHHVSSSGSSARPLHEAGAAQQHCSTNLPPVGPSEAILMHPQTSPQFV